MDDVKKKLELQTTIVSPGVVKGKARLINEEYDLSLVEDGEIVILPYSHPMYAMAVMKASGIICEAGGKLSHICIVSLEMGIPCLTRVLGVMNKIQTGDVIELDAERGVIYQYDE